MNYINVLEIFKDFADLHLAIKRYKNGPIDEISTFCNENESFPILYTTLQSVTIQNINEYKFKQYTVVVYILVPRINLYPTTDDKLLLNQYSNNLNEVLKINDDLYLSLINLDEVDISTNNITNIYNYTSDVVEGIMNTFIIDVPLELCGESMSGELTIKKYNC
jgi:hypothetical protein